MRIVLFHYHLKPGGVTTVIRHQIAALKNSCEVIIMTGEKPQEKWPVPIVVIPDLSYKLNAFSPKKTNKIAGDIINYISKKWKNGCDVLHVHNPLLAKNKNLLKILNVLQHKGIKLFLQIHDFAEDGRVLSYFSEEYPAHCHYGVINSRDYHILLKSGLRPEGLHKISNIIMPLKTLKKSSTKEKNLILYPVRGIRRKNLGEAILLSLFLKNNETIGITLPPSSEKNTLSKDVPFYLKWKEFVKANHLNFSFELGIKHDFRELVTNAKMILTTSITEGFGFTFLEPWTANKFLAGRRIPDICVDFEEEGISLDHLYTQLFIPLKLIDSKEFFKKWKNCIVKNCKIMDYPLTKQDIEKAAFNLMVNDCLDFRLFDETTQRKIISLALKDKKSLFEIIDNNPWLENFTNTKNRTTLINRNKKIILNHYTTKNYCEKLINIYKKAKSNPVKQAINKTVLLRSFFNLNSFSLLKWN
ncbi:hypothetical protein ACFLQ1_00130 [Candidatus Auribacterota bacterium]